MSGGGASDEFIDLTGDRRGNPEHQDRRDAKVTHFGRGGVSDGNPIWSITNFRSKCRLCTLVFTLAPAMSGRTDTRGPA